MTNGRCKNCKHYHEDFKNEDETNNTNCTSGKFVYPQGKSAPNDGVEFSDYESYSASLKVNPEFGCVHFEPSETIFEKIKDLCLEGLCTDGGHHKQYYLEEILRLTGLFDVDTHQDYLWNKGIPG